MCALSIVPLLLHKMALLAKTGGFAAAMLCMIPMVLGSCTTETWGRSRTTLYTMALEGARETAVGRTPERESLLAEMDRRREEGAAESRWVIEKLFPDSGKLVSEDPEAARAAEAGELKAASAAWWGYDAEDATDALSEALTAPVELLVIPAMAGPWISGPLEIAGPRHIIFEPGAELLAKAGEFLPTGDTLLTLYRAADVTLTGYGARIAMRKSDYISEPYQWSQHRHALSLLESRNISVQGFLIESSGGDGIYIGQSRGGEIPRNILLKDLHLIDNYRQGVSVISVDGFRMEYTYIAETEGTPPGAAIDFEPNSRLYGLTDCVVVGCLFEKNAGAGLTVHLPNVLETHPPVSILVQDTLILGNPYSVWIRGLDNGVRGSLEFRNTRVKGVGTIERSDTFMVLN
ncbi:right-handed parallel beta-helix repeat-containing protein [Marispirochaeta sp.]|uniref:right-handed parallel beta-helix repeat-containing protein n=1 Tax=Marispirochaeta sp. TaxID=2038653 RepID=UPI0029C7D8FC|nr:right-handed parallel beta-helix repeat-containing protein [Marispirochaeta sp.]